MNVLQLLENMESKMKNTCVDNTIPKLFEGKMLVSLLMYSIALLGYFIVTPVVDEISQVSYKM